MPIHKATGPRGGKGWQYGQHGKVYPTRKQAVAQAQAIKAAQAAAKKSKQIDLAIRFAYTLYATCKNTLLPNLPFVVNSLND